MTLRRQQSSVAGRHRPIRTRRLLGGIAVDTSPIVSSKWGRDTFASLQAQTVAYPIRECSIDVLMEPADFYATVLDLAGRAERRVVLSSLYLGTGEMEQQLVGFLSARRAWQESMRIATRCLLLHAFYCLLLCCCLLIRGCFCRRRC